jgi:molecular chaperone DnaK
MTKAVGVDLRATKPMIAAVEDGQPTVIPNVEGSRTAPSVVAFTELHEWVDGALRGDT